MLDRRNNDTLAVHPVAIGSKEWPTQAGSWAINQSEKQIITLTRVVPIRVY